MSRVSQFKVKTIITSSYINMNIFVIKESGHWGSEHHTFIGGVGQPNQGASGGSGQYVHHSMGWTFENATQAPINCLQMPPPQVSIMCVTQSVWVHVSQP